MTKAVDLGVNSILIFVPTTRRFTVVKVTKRYIWLQQLDTCYKAGRWTFKKLQDSLDVGEFYILKKTKIK